MFVFQLIMEIGNISYRKQWVSNQTLLFFFSRYCLVYSVIMPHDGAFVPIFNFCLLTFWDQMRHGGSIFMCSLKCLCNPAYIMSFELPCLTAVLNLVSFSLVDWCDSDKPEKINICFSLFNQSDSDQPEKINISLHCGCCLWTLHDHQAIQVITIEANLNPFFFNFEGSEFLGSEVSGSEFFRGLSFRVLRSEFSGSEFSWHPLLYQFFDLADLAVVMHTWPQS